MEVQVLKRQGRSIRQIAKEMDLSRNTVRRYRTIRAMATVRKYRGRWVADYRDQHDKRRIEKPRGSFENLSQERIAVQELLTKRQAEVARGDCVAARARLTFGDVCDRLHGEIKTLGEWWHYLESCWLLNSSLDADVISDRLRSKIDSNDRLLVINVGRNYAGWLPQDAWAWIQARA